MERAEVMKFVKPLSETEIETLQLMPRYHPSRRARMRAHCILLIEILWRFMKYYWLPFSAYASFQSLVAAVEDLLNRFGTDYRIAFKAT
jgi:hypothetical protein